MSAEAEDQVPVEEPAAEKSPLQNDIDRLDPVSDIVSLLSGTQVQVMPLRARQFFKLMRIVTNGGGAMLPNLALAASGDARQFAMQFVGLVVFAIPEAEDQAIDFVKSMVTVPGTNVKDKAAVQHSQKLLDDELDDPELDDLITVIECVVRREADDIRALGKRLQAMFSLAQKTGQVGTP